eukprot:TRINITY_DN24260_c0_g1_i1.p1 TRINITY_DN24260_c0_g1~~TRINITY_DN24260_c0_g1_i1.p1  ORF type:complete len:605 (-),score=161.65 TRINITY_DN24260_c0_g1_i1:317-2131(-)
MAQPKILRKDSSSSSESDSDASSSESIEETEPVTVPKKPPGTLIVGRGRPGGTPGLKPLVVKSAVDLEVAQPTKRTRAGNEDTDEPENKKKKSGDADKGYDDVDSKKKRGGAVDKAVEELEVRKRKSGKVENGVDKVQPQKQPSKRERKVAADKVQKEEQVNESSVVQKADKDKPIVSDKRGSKGRKPSREAEAVQREESPKSSPPLRPDVAEDSTPLKQRNSSHWSFEDEMSLSEEVLAHLKPGQQATSGKGDVWFLQLIKDSEGKLRGQWSKEQLSDKIRRMKDRYNQLEDRIKDPQASRKFKNRNEEKLFNTYWKRIWGPTASEPAKPPAKSPETEEENEEEETEDEAADEVPPSTSPKRAEHSPEETSDESEGKEDDVAEDEEKEGNDSDQGNGETSKHLNHIAQKSPARPSTQDNEYQAVPRLLQIDKVVEATLENAHTGGMKSDDAMDVDLGRHDDKKQVDLAALSEDLLNCNKAFLAKLESKLESKLLAVEQVQEKTLAALEDVKMYQNRLISLVEVLGTRVAGVSMPVLGGLGSSIPGLLGGLGGSGITSNGVHGGTEYLKLQKQWQDLDMDELGCIVRRIQLVQEQRKLQDGNFP